MESEFLVVIFIMFLIIIAGMGAGIGFFKAVEATFFLILFTVLTIAITPKVCGILGSCRFVNKFMDESVQGIVSESTEKLAAGEDVWLLRNVALPDELEAALQSGDADVVLSEPVQTGLGGPVRKYFIYVMSATITMGAFFVALLLLKGPLDKLIKFPKARTIDRVMGAVLGILEGLIIVFMILALLHLYEFTEICASILQFVRGSSLLAMLDDCNLIYHAARHAMGLH